MAIQNNNFSSFIFKEKSDVYSSILSKTENLKIFLNVKQELLQYRNVVKQKKRMLLMIWKLLKDFTLQSILLLKKNNLWTFCKKKLKKKKEIKISSQTLLKKGTF